MKNGLLVLLTLNNRTRKMDHPLLSLGVLTCGNHVADGKGEGQRVESDKLGPVQEPGQGPLQGLTLVAR